MNIHDSMLFRWTGYDIEKPELKAKPAPRRKELTVKPELTDAHVKDYLDRLRDALNPKIGLKVSAYSDVDAVGKIRPIIKHPKPCLFFTEQAAGDLEEHWRLYGRLGFGFSKRFIFDCGGRPVIYAGGGKDPVLASIGYIRKTLSESKEFKDGHKIRQEFETLARFIKWTTPPLKKEDQAEKKETEPEIKSNTAQKKIKLAQKASELIQPLEFPVAQTICYLREREWRLLQRDSDKQRWRVDADGGTWFKPEAGKELQLIIVPCNLILHQAYEDKDIRKNLRGSSGITAQLISAQALRKL
jgi:hypothetical protein